MPWDEVTPPPVSAPFLKPGDTLEGVYLGSLPSKYNAIHLLKVNDEDSITFYGTDMLDALLDRIHIGNQVKILLLELIQTSHNRIFKKFQVWQHRPDQDPVSDGSSAQSSPEGNGQDIPF